MSEQKIHVVSMTLTTSGLRGTLTSDGHLVGRIEFPSQDAAEFYEAFIAHLCRPGTT